MRCLNWARRDTYVLGFGPFPIIFSTNLFLWFKPDWFYLQFVLVALGFAAKELIRWSKDGRQTHIFNPSSFPLAVCLADPARDGNHAPDLGDGDRDHPDVPALHLRADLPGGAARTILVRSHADDDVGGRHVVRVLASPTSRRPESDWYCQTYIPIASFLGMHLLFTDPSTSPRTELGRILFGILYGASIAALYGLLEAYGQPSFYDKLLAVPILNLLIQLIDRFASCASRRSGSIPRRS